MRILCDDQDSALWFDVRIGKVTASCIHSAMKMVHKGSVKRNDKRWESSSIRKAYISELAWGMINRVPVEHYVSRAMDLGKQYEKMARAEYGFRFSPDEDVELTGFVLHPTIDWLGATPVFASKAVQSSGRWSLYLLMGVLWPIAFLGMMVRHAVASINAKPKIQRRERTPSRSDISNNGHARGEPAPAEPDEREPALKD